MDRIRKSLVCSYDNSGEDIEHKLCIQFGQDKMCAHAAARGHIECLKTAYENGYNWESDTCAKAVYGNHLDCLRFAYENGCPVKMRHQMEV